MAMHAQIACQFRLTQPQLTTGKLFKSIATPSGRTALVRADPGKAALAQQVKLVTQNLADAGDLIKRRASDDEAKSATNDAREEALWARQEAWWAHEASRWEMERESWAAREAKLLEYISKLQDLVVELAKRQAGSTPDLSPLAAGQAAQKRPESLTAQPSVSEAQRADAVRTKQPRRPESGLRSIVDEASQYLPEEDQAFEAPRPDDFSPLNAEVLEDDPDVERVRSSLQSAFAAIDNADVLSSDYDTALASKPQAPPLESPSQQPGAATEAARSNGNPSSRPPTLRLGADDIFWMSQLHNALMKGSFYPGEEDMEDWYYGDQTQSAVLTFQASKGLPETGIVDDATWRQLLGPGYADIKPPPEPEGVPSAEAASLSQALGAKAATSQASEEDSELRQIRQLREKSELENRKRNDYVETSHPGLPTLQSTAWPALTEGDGGKDVHHLHVALEQKGFIADTEDQRWWFFGSSTNDCVLTFQACSGLPETGAVDNDTWQALLPPSSTPAALDNLTNEFEDDMSDDSEAVWLLGEQRWERRKKTVP